MASIGEIMSRFIANSGNRNDKKYGGRNGNGKRRQYEDDLFGVS